MLPHIPRTIWLKSSQWASLTRAHAHLVYADDTIMHVFAEHCRPPTCVGDEHYLPVLLAYHHEENNTACSGNSVATRWGQGEPNMQNRKAPGNNAVTEYRAEGLKCIPLKRRGKMRKFHDMEAGRASNILQLWTLPF